MRPQAPASGSPANGSSEVTRASSTAPCTSRASPAGLRSLVEVEALLVPRKTRSPAAWEPESFSCSTSPLRTSASNSSPS
jgi:hypothetical protein